MTAPSLRPGPRQADAVLLVLDRFEQFVPWLLARTARWPRTARFTLSQRLENHALDVLEQLVVARYERHGRRRRLDDVNLVLERMRHLLRMAHEAGACPLRTFEAAVRSLDEVGRMLHGWRAALARTREGSA